METVIDIPAEHEANVFGQFDAYAKKIERALHVTLIARGESVKIMGDALKVEKAKKSAGSACRTFKKRQHDPGTECRLHSGTGYGRQRRKRTGDR